MKKETLIAITFGVVLGIIGAVIMVARAKQMETARAKQISGNLKNITPTVSLGGLKVQTLEVIEPKDSSLFTGNSIRIKGRANADSLVVIHSPIKDLIFKSDKKDFSATFPLALGENVISVSVYPKDKQIPPQERILKVYYLDEK